MLWGLQKERVIPVGVFLMDVQKHLTLCASTGLLLVPLSIWGELRRYSTYSGHALRVIFMHAKVEELLGTSKMKMSLLLLGEGSRKESTGESSPSYNLHIYKSNYLEFSIFLKK